MEVRRRRWRVGAPFAAALLLAVQMFNWAPLASAQKAGDPVDLRGFATGQPVHAGALESGTRVVNAEVAWSAAAVDADADGLKGAKYNEVNRIYQPDKSGKLSYARASGLEVGIATNPPDANQLILAGLAQAAAAPSSKDDQQVEVAGADPLAYASLVRGNAVANSNDSGLVPDVCVLGDDLSRGLGYAADAQLIDAGGNTLAPRLDAPILEADATQPERAVSNSLSRERLVPTGKPDNFGLMSEVRQTIAPVTVLADNTNPANPRLLTIELLGEWVLRVVATGDGKSQVFYGPGKVNPQSHIVRILDSANAAPLELTFQDIFDNAGLNIPIDPLINITIGEAPRAIAKPGADPNYGSKPTITPTEVSAAVDVVRVRIGPAGAVADVRVGHMEAQAHVPAGGINCPIPVTKTADPDNIRIREAPDTSHITITVHNVYNCDLTNTVLTDQIRQKAGDPDFQLVTSDPAADSPSMPTGNLRTADVVWSLGTIPKGSTKAVTLDLKSATSGGIIRDIASATGKMANCTGSDEAGLAVAGLAIAGLNISGLSVPVDVNVEIPRTGANTRNTVATGAGLAIVALAASIVMRRRDRRLGSNV
jgi:LPXTG-motif cell wall-anchored protein